jgi:hypothetical protein
MVCCGRIAAAKTGRSLKPPFFPGRWIVGFQNPHLVDAERAGLIGGAMHGSSGVYKFKLLKEHEHVKT